MTTVKETPAVDISHALEYVHARITTYYSQKSDYVAKFIERGLRAEGWWAIEAFYALTNRTAAQVVLVEAVRGPSEGDTGFNPDLELRVGTQSHQIAIKSLPLKGKRDIPYYFSKELSSLFQWINNLKSRAVLITVAYPCASDEEGWKQAVAEAEAAHQVKAIEHRQFLVPQPPLPLAKACVTLWRHASVA